MAVGKELHLVGFRVGDETFAVPIALVHEIVRVPAITAVPETPGCVEGIINLRGKVIPVVDLRKRFGQAIGPSKKNRILVAEHEGRLVGLMVDAASEVLKLASDDVEPPPGMFDDGNLNYVAGVGKLNGRLLLLVDLNKLLAQGELKNASSESVNL